MSGSRGDESDGEIDDEDRLAAALAVLAQRRTDGTPALASWRRRRLAALGASASGESLVTFRFRPFTARGGPRSTLD
jgi:hypothetical protein